MSRESSEPLFMIQDVDAPSSKSISETLININTTPSISLPLKEPTLDNIYSLAEKLPSPPETSSQSTESPKVPPSATSSLPLVTKEPTPDALELTPPLSDTPMTEAEPESDFHQVPERPSQVFAEPQSVSLLVEVETKSQSWRLVLCSTSSRDSERDSQESEVLEWTPSTILTEVVTTSTWVSQARSADSPHRVKRSVSLPPEEPVSSEVPRPLRTSPKRSDSHTYLNFSFSFFTERNALNFWILL